MRLDDVVTGRANFRAVIDEISQEADRLIRTLRASRGITVDLTKPPKSSAARSKGRKDSAERGEDRERRPGQKAGAPKPAETHRAKAQPLAAHDNGSPQRARQSNGQGRNGHHVQDSGQPRRAPPTERMIAFARRIASDKKAELPPGFDKDFEICRRFLDQNAGR
jgi:DNA topoisomerase-3